MIALYIILTIAISVFNAWATGRNWVESKAAGGAARFMSWMGAIMSACGFSWAYLAVIAIVAGPDCLGKLKPQYVEAMLSLGYLALIVPIIGSGLAITVESWAYFWRRRTFGSAAIAGYNTFADVYNIYEAVRFAPSAWDNVAGLFKSDKKSGSSSSDDNGAAGLVILLVIMALAAGILTTAAIISTTSKATAGARAMRYAR